MKRETVGSSSIKAATSGQTCLDPREIQRATEKEYLDNLVWAVNHARKEVDCSSIDGHDYCQQREAFKGNFYIAALLKKEKLLDNVLRNYFIPTIDCPTPYYDQTIYRYNDKKGDIEFLWVIPDKETCEIFIENRNIIVPSERGLLEFILDFYSGKLLQIAKNLNGETGFAGGALKGN